MRHWLALAAATALGAAAAPAMAQQAPPPAPPPAWADPQAPQGPVFPGGPVYAGAPFAHPLPPGVAPGMPLPPPGTAGPHPHGPMAWQSEPGRGYAADGGYAYGYQYGAPAAPCGCGGGYTVTWVPIRIETRYTYTPAIRHEREVVEESVVRREVVETKTVPVRESKYVRSAPAKPTKSKIVRTTK